MVSVHVMWNGEYVITQSRVNPSALDPTGTVVPNVPVPTVPVPDPAAPELVPVPVAAGTTPETVPWSWGEAIADDQSPVEPATAKFA